MGAIRNTVTFEYRVQEGLRTHTGVGVRGGSHAERSVWLELQRMDVESAAVTRIHAELQPCDIPGGYCAPWIREEFPDAQVSWSFDYGLDVTSRCAAVAGLREAIAGRDAIGLPGDGDAAGDAQRGPVGGAEIATAAGGCTDAEGSAGPAACVATAGSGAITRAELIAEFGQFGIVPADRRVCNGLNLLPETVASLVEVGMPRYVDSFFGAGALDAVDSALPGGPWVRFGDDWGAHICVSAATGQVMALPVRDRPARFVNSSVALFVEFLMHTCAMTKPFPQLLDEQIDPVVLELEQLLGRLDPPAFSHPENWWSVMMEQMRDGLL